MTVIGKLITINLRLWMKRACTYPCPWISLFLVSKKKLTISLRQRLHQRRRRLLLFVGSTSSTNEGATDEVKDAPKADPSKVMTNIMNIPTPTVPGETPHLRARRKVTSIRTMSPDHLGAC